MEWSEQKWEPVPDGHVRSPGLHLSQLIREIERDLLGDDKRPDDSGSDRAGWFEGGFIFEEMCAAMLRRTKRGKLLIVQKEVEKDGIFMTPDIVDPVDEGVVDSKMTWKSTRQIDDIVAGKTTWDKVWPGYMVQLKAYAHYYGYTKGALVVLFVMGNWKRGPEWSGPSKPRVFVFRWTEEELKRNWKMVLRYRDAWVKRGGPRPYDKAKGSGPVFEW